MRSDKLPSLLSNPNPANSISVERALKQIKLLLEEIPEGDDALEDRISSAVSDIDFMLSAIDHS